jgi:cob(I)alamin adenosyltransferase
MPKNKIKNKIIEDLIKKGKCLKCGLCCKAIGLSVSPEILSKLEDGNNLDFKFASDNFINITIDEAFEINPYLKNWSTGLFYYKCKQFDNNLNKCIIHKSKPYICAGFPHYGHPVDYYENGIPYSDKCGHQTYLSLYSLTLRKNGGYNLNNLHSPKFDKNGYIQIYTGEGKGKTTASIGLTTRALGRGWKVLVMQFLKVSDETGEYKCLIRNNKNLTYLSCGMPHYPTMKNIGSLDKSSFDEGWSFVKENYNNYDLIVLDELNIAIDFNFITVEEVLEFLNNKLDNVEIVISGRNARKEIIEIANLVTEMKSIKHYWDSGVKAREGVEY